MLRKFLFIFTAISMLLTNVSAADIFYESVTFYNDSTSNTVINENYVYGDTAFESLYHIDRIDYVDETTPFEMVYDERFPYAAIDAPGAIINDTHITNDINDINNANDNANNTNVINDNNKNNNNNDAANDATIDAAADAMDKISYSTISLKIGVPIGLIDYNHKVDIDSSNKNVSPLIVSDRTMVPLRFVAENFGAQVEWENKTRTVTVTNDDVEISMQIGDPVISVNGEQYEIDSPPVIVQDRTMLPLRALSEFGFEKVLHWDDDNQVIIVADTYDSMWDDEKFIQTVLRRLMGEEDEMTIANAVHSEVIFNEELTHDGLAHDGGAQGEYIYDEVLFGEYIQSEEEDSTQSSGDDSDDDDDSDSGGNDTDSIKDTQGDSDKDDDKDKDDTHDVGDIDGPSIVNPYTVYTYEQMLSDAAALAERYASLIKVSTAGYSVQGRTLPLIKFGRGSKKVYIEASAHGREYITSSFIMYFIEKAAYNYYKRDSTFEGYDVKGVLDDTTYYILPMVNPDGVTIAQNGPTGENADEIKAMKLMEPSLGYKSWKANANGVDFNANYPINWTKSVNPPNSNGNAGTGPASEPEVQVVVDLVDSVNFDMFGSFHTQGEVIYWHDTGYNSKTEAYAEKVVNMIAAKTGYMKMSKTQSAGAGMCSYARGKYQKPAFTFELAPYIGNYPYPDKNFDDVWKKAKIIPLLLSLAIEN